MNRRAYLLAALLVSPAWSQEPASFDLKSDAIKKIVQDAASRQIVDVQESEKAPAKAEPAEFKYEPPEKTTPPVREWPHRLPDPPPPSKGFVSALFDIALDELLGVESDDVNASNDLLRCRVQKETKTSPPGPDRCPNVY